MPTQEHARLRELAEANQGLEKDIEKLQQRHQQLRKELAGRELSPTAGRRMVRWLMRDHGMSERQACELIGVHRSTVRYHPLAEEPEAGRPRPRVEHDSPLLQWLTGLTFEVQYRPPQSRRSQRFRVRLDIE